MEIGGSYDTVKEWRLSDHAERLEANGNFTEEDYVIMHGLHFGLYWVSGSNFNPESLRVNLSKMGVPAEKFGVSISMAIS